MVVTPLLLLTDARQARVPLPQVVAAAGVTTVLREKHLPRADRARLAAVLRATGVEVVAAGSDPLGGDAVHLGAREGPRPRGVRRAGRSCHDEVEVARAVDGGEMDYLIVSPVFPTASKPGYGPQLGLEGLTRLAALAAPLPVYALGGIETPEQAADCLRAGAAGVAVMGALMRCPDPAALARDLMAALASAMADGFEKA